MTKNRITSLDLLKGLVIIIMALDHVRGYFHYPSFFFNPTDPELSTLPIFFTRFVTNICAPAFSFLAGVSAYIVGRRKDKQELSLFLLKRGLWLVFIELVVMNFGWHFDLHFTNIAFQVIWILGISMIFLAALVHVPLRYLAIFSVVLIFGHNLLDNITFKDSVLWSFLHERKRYEDLIPGHVISISYVVIPWIAVMSLGFCFGSLYDKSYNPVNRKRLLNVLGIAALLLFLLIRSANIYGDLEPWKNYGNMSQNIMSFLKLTKYPPSLSFLLVTLGVTFLCLANAERLKGKAVDFLAVFGRVPFFFYIIHIYLIHLLALLVAGFTGFGWQKMILPAVPSRVEALKGFGYNLIIVYLIWVGIIIMLYPLCKAFDNYKQQHKEKWWLSYL